MKLVSEGRDLRRDIIPALRAARRGDLMWRQALVIALWLDTLRLFKLGVPEKELFRSNRARPRNRLGRWLFDWLRTRQREDKGHHAPLCPANRWSGMELVIQPCNCGAWRIAGITKTMNKER